MVARISRWCLLAGLSLLLLTACQTAPSQLGDVLGHASSRQAFVSRHRQKARRLEAAGDIADAQREWQLVDAVSPQAAGREIARLQAEIDRRFDRHRSAAEQAVKKQQYQGARRHLLQALALKPDRTDVIELMKETEARVAYARLDDTPGVAKGDVREIDVYTAAHDHSDGGDGESNRRAGTVPRKPAADLRDADIDKRIRIGAKHLSRKDYETALQIFTEAHADSRVPDARLDAYIAKTRHALADRHYDQGVAAFRTARYGEAVKEFELVLRYAPDHHKARFYLSSAESLRKQ